MINIFSFILFAFRVGTHKVLLRCLANVQQSFADQFGTKKGPPFFRLNLYMTLGVLVTFASIFALRVVMFFMLKEEFGQKLSNDFSLLSAPLLSVWNVIPLIYFHQIHVMIRAWGAQLIGEIRRNYKPQPIQQQRLRSPAGGARKHSLKFYYQRFVELVELQMATGDFFNPYIAFTFLWSIFILCLMIYFVINAGDSFADPPIPFTAEQMVRWRLVIHFNFAWIGFQIALGIVHLLSICDSGRRTNEEVGSALTVTVQFCL